MHALYNLSYQCLIHTEVHDLCIMLKVLDLLTSFPLT